MTPNKIIDKLDDLANKSGVPLLVSINDQDTRDWLDKPRPWLKWVLLLPFLIFLSAGLLRVFGFAVASQILAPAAVMFSLVGYASKYRFDQQRKASELDERQQEILLLAYRRAFFTVMFVLMFGCLALSLNSVFSSILSGGLKFAPSDATLIAYIAIFGIPLLPALFAEWSDRSNLDEEME